uniref:Uncharacterized protein n=1 Tax=Utricularia reniformis TaxID=192314 RepID=A0A1Y0B3Y7_9LAMI|nr:hypothetical protein AEK19_MT1944 [Utricularia reniformis]ART32108.1 hypothetical protein AEK19_MT1944 [Utricularia reniformis]
MRCVALLTGEHFHQDVMLVDQDPFPSQCVKELWHLSNSLAGAGVKELGRRLRRDAEKGLQLFLVQSQ